MGKGPVGAIRGMRALARQLSETQAQAALAPVLEQVDRTSNTDALEELAQAVHALAPKLSNEQWPQLQKAIGWGPSARVNTELAIAIAQIARNEDVGTANREIFRILEFPTSGGQPKTSCLTPCTPAIRTLPEREQGWPQI